MSGQTGVGEKVGPTADWKCLSGKGGFGTCHNGPRSLPNGAEVGYDAFTGGAKYCKSMAEDGGKCRECRGLLGEGNKFCDIAYEGTVWKEVGTEQPTSGTEWVNVELADALTRKQTFTAEEFKEFDLFRDVPEEDRMKQRTILNADDYILGTNGRYYQPVLECTTANQASGRNPSAT